MMYRWLCCGTNPPDSIFPRVSDGTLVKGEDCYSFFRDIPTYTRGRTSDVVGKVKAAHVRHHPFSFPQDIQRIPVNENTRNAVSEKFSRRGPAFGSKVPQVRAC